MSIILSAKHLGVPWKQGTIVVRQALHYTEFKYFLIALYR